MDTPKGAGKNLFGSDLTGMEKGIAFFRLRRGIHGLASEPLCDSKQGCRAHGVFLPQAELPARFARSKKGWLRAITWLALLTFAAAVLLNGCSTLRLSYDRRHGIGAQSLEIPPSVDAMLRRHGFEPIDPREARHPRRVWWCVRPVNIPGGRMAAQVGWFHEWILAPGFEGGADFRGADSVQGTWPQSPEAFLLPLHISDHRGASLHAGTYCRELTNVTPKAIHQAARKMPQAGWLPFPFHNCHTWVRKVVREARRNSSP